MQRRPPRKGAAGQPLRASPRWRKLEGQAAELRAACEVVMRDDKELSRQAKAQAAALHEAVQLTDSAQADSAQAAVAAEVASTNVQAAARKLQQAQESVATALQALAKEEAEARAELDAAHTRLKAVLQQPSTAGDAKQQLNSQLPNSQQQQRQPTRQPAPQPAQPRHTASSAREPAAPSTSSLPVEVAACDDFLARQGHTGGWQSEEHAEFLRVLKACRGNYGHCVTVCCEQQLGLLHDRRAIIQHARRALCCRRKPARPSSPEAPCVRLPGANLCALCL